MYSLNRGKRLDSNRSLNPIHRKRVKHWFNLSSSIMKRRPLFLVLVLLSQVRILANSSEVVNLYLVENVTLGLTNRLGPRSRRRDAWKRLEGDGTRGQVVGPGHEGGELGAVGSQLHHELEASEEEVRTSTDLNILGGRVGGLSRCIWSLSARIDLCAKLYLCCVDWKA